jgi:hypothetical protein
LGGGKPPFLTKRLWYLSDNSGRKAYNANARVKIESLEVRTVVYPAQVMDMFDFRF